MKNCCTSKYTVPLNITALPVGTKSGRIIRKPNRYLEEC